MLKAFPNNLASYKMQWYNDLKSYHQKTTNIIAEKSRETKTT